MNIIQEGETSIIVETQKIVNKKMPVFYNPVMIVNRDFSLLVLQALNKKELIIGDILAGSGIRTLRILKELNKDIVKKIIVNDIKPNFKEIIQKNIELNKLENISEKIIIKNEDANTALTNDEHFDYIELDPYGTPNPFIDTSIKRLKRKGILSVTATDTSCLCGSYPKACYRKYWSKPLRNELMHEFATRILARKIQLIGAQHEKALTPLVSIATDHYIKIFFTTENNKTKTDEILKKHETYNEKGPIWLGPLHNAEFIEKMIQETQKISISKKTTKLLETLKEEAKIETPFFYDLHVLAKKMKTKTIPRIDTMMEELKKQKYKATRTHFNQNAIKTNAPQKEIETIFEKLTITSLN